MINTPTAKWLRNLTVAAWAATTLSLSAQPAGQWDFNAGNLNATVGSPLQHIGGGTGTSYGTTTSFGIPDIGGVPANVMKFDAGVSGGGYRMPVGVLANGGGTLVNNYTVVMDVLFPTESGTVRRPLVETDLGLVATTEGAEFVIDASGGFAGVGNVRGSITTNTWYRLGIVVEGSANVVRLYINGVEQGTFAAGGVDGRLALNDSASSDPFAELFKDLNGATELGYVNSVQFRGSALSPGQMLALGGATAAGIPQVIPPVPPYFRSRSPEPNATGIVPNVTIAAVLDQGDRIITPGSVKLLLDGAEVPATITPSVPTFTINYPVPTLLSSESLHTIGVSYTDNVAGAQTVSWTFRVAKYQSVTLPAPIHLETFDALAQGALPAGWTVTNNTEAHIAGSNFSEPRSDSYRDWVVISRTTANGWINTDSARRFELPPVVLNGALLPSLVSDNFAYAESDVRSGSQVQVMFTGDYNLTGRNNVFVSFWSSYEQNQDNVGSLEYSIDGGTTWLPVVYMIDDQDKNADVLYSDQAKTQIDAVATLNRTQTDQAYGLSYGAFIGAPVSQALAPYISGRINDDPRESKRIELFRLPQADNQAAVRFRFMQAGTASWYWGIDNFGLYSINTPVITQQPAAQKINAEESATFNVVATINPPFTYQWLFNNNPINGATQDSYTVTDAEAANAGEYKVVVTNSDGSTTSQAAVLTVVTGPEITSQPRNVLVSAGSPATFTVQAMGRAPLSYQWFKGTDPINNATSASYTISPTATTDAGDYSVEVSNVDDDVTSNVAVLTVFDGPITTDLVTHLKFDGNLTDSSGQSVNGTQVGNTPFSASPIGQSVGFSTSAAAGRNYITLGAPTQLNFGTSTDFTIAFWINYAQRNSDPAVIANKDWDSGGNQGWVFAPSSSGLKWNIADSTRVRRDSPGLGTLNNGQWHHFLTTFDRSGLAITYIDGVPVNSVDISGMTQTVDTPNGLSVNIGEDGTGAYNNTTTGSPGFPDAKLDDLGIWRRALTPEEVRGIYQTGLAGQDLQQAEAIRPPLPAVTASRVNNNLNLTWPAEPTVRLQQATTLSPPNWQDVPGTTGQGAASLPINPTGGTFFQTTQP